MLRSARLREVFVIITTMKQTIWIQIAIDRTNTYCDGKFGFMAISTSLGWQIYPLNLQDDQLLDVDGEWANQCLTELAAKICSKDTDLKAMFVEGMRS